MKEKILTLRNNATLLILITLSVIYVTIIFTNKEGMHVDEYFTYLLANTQTFVSDDGIAGPSGIKYLPQEFYASILHQMDLIGKTCGFLKLPMYIPRCILWQFIFFQAYGKASLLSVPVSS
ncbi:MAG: hypothetical protein LBV33_07240 [Lachnospiraceae bacterium]|jgi:hypothetical protein|nr:hypothetical protein [Lachnospiraceae bacterium]